MKLCRHDFGTIIALGIQDETKEDIERHFFSFWNHQATSGELHWINEKFAYFWTTPENLEFALIQSSLFRLLNIHTGKAKGKVRGLMPEAQILAQQRIKEIEQDSFLGRFENELELVPYQLGYLDYETPDIKEFTNIYGVHLTS